MENLKNDRWNKGKTDWEDIEARVDGKRVKAEMGKRAAMGAAMAATEAEKVDHSEVEVWPLEKMFEAGKFEGTGEEEGGVRKVEENEERARRVERKGGDGGVRRVEENEGGARRVERDEKRRVERNEGGARKVNEGEGGAERVERKLENFDGDAESDRGGYESEETRSEKWEKDYQAVAEMTKEEATEEYLDLLDEISRGFTSVEAQASGAAFRDENGEVISRGVGYSGEKNRIVGQLEGSDGKHEKREWSIAMADDIIRAELDWRRINDKTTLEKERLASDQAELKLARARKEAEEKLEAFEGGAFGGLRKVLRPRRHVELQNEVMGLKWQEPERTLSAQKTTEVNRRMQKALEAAYSEDYGYGHHHLKPGRNADKLNEEYNERFFSEENMPKIDRAVALRRRLEELEPRISSAWKDKYWMETAKNGEGTEA